MGTHSSQRVKTLIRGIINSGTLFVLHDLAVQEERGPRHVRSKISVTEGNSRVPFMCKSPQMNLPVFDSEILASNFSAKSIGRPDFILSSTPRISAGNGTLRILQIVRLIRSALTNVGLFAGSTARYEIAAQIFLATLRAARRHREFSVLDLQEQNGILRRGWAAAFVLRAAIWPLDLTSFWKTDGVFIREGVQEVLAAARSAVSNLRLDRTEISVLETLALCRPGKSYSSFLGSLFLALKVF